MPYYDYCCEKCGKEFEIFAGINDPRDDVRCEACGGGARRLFDSIVTAKKSGSGGSSSASSCSTCSTRNCSSCG